MVCFELGWTKPTIAGCVMYTFFKIFIVVVLTQNENPKGTVPPGESFLPGDIKYESPNRNFRIYFPIVTSIVLSVLFTLILRFTGTKRTA
jgi:hypothetical protein